MSILQLSRKAPALVAVAILAATISKPAAAQGGVNLVPWAGVYVPTRNNVSKLGADIFQRDVSVIGGARLTFWGTGNLGFEATGGYAPAKFSGETINEGNSNLLVASGRLLFSPTPVTDRVSFYIGAGPALLTRGRNTFDDDKSHTDFGGTAGLGFRFALGESGSSAVRLDFEDYLYNGDFGGGDKFQNDLVGSLGLSLSLGGKASEQ
ncbi:MAG: outer membrane beta-barrel protein [Gemmatimonadales bacterium]